MFACVAGCGDDGDARHLPDAPVADDAAAIDAAPIGNVTVTAHVRCCDVAPTTPQAGVLVVVVQADGTAGETGTTDALGKVTLANVRAGATVTAVYPDDGDQGRHVTMMAGVKPGDDLTFGQDYYEPTASGADGQIDASWTAVTDAAYYYVFAPCEVRYVSAPSTSAALAVYTSCQTPTAPVAFVAYDGAGNVLASAYLPAATYTPGSALVAPAWTAQAAGANFQVSISGLAPAVNDVRFTSVASYGSLRTYPAVAYPALKAGAGMASLSIPETALSIDTSAQLHRSGTQGRQFMFKRGASPIAFTTPALPWINGIAVSPGDGRAIWLQSAGTYDAAVLSFSWSRTENKATRYYDWTVILPPGVTELDLGTPPAALAPYLPTADDDLGSDLHLVDLSSVSDYDAIRALPEWRLVDVEGSVRHGDEPTAAVSTYDGGEGFGFAP